MSPCGSRKKGPMSPLFCTQECVWMMSADGDKDEVAGGH